MPETFVRLFAHLKDIPKADRTLPMLQHVASLVPIIRKHGWVLSTLAEFFPRIYLVSPDLPDAA